MSNKSSKHDFIKTMFTIGIVGIFIIIIMAFVLFKIVTGDEPKSQEKSKNNTTVVEDKSKNKENVPKEVSYKRVVGVIKNIDINSKSLEIIDLNNDTVVKLKFDETIEIKDKYGQAITFSELNVGDMISAKYNTYDNKPETFRISGETWEKKNIDQIYVDTTNKIIQKNNDNYHYNDSLITLYKGKPFKISSLTNVDKVTLRGYKDKVCVVILEKSHGYIILKNYNSFIDGMVDIDRDKSIAVKKQMDKIMINEGVHKIVADKDGFEPYVTEVMVKAGETVEVSLGSAQIKKGSVEFRFNEKDVKLYINGELQSNIDQPILLDYGKYDILVKKDEKSKEFKDILTVDKPYILYTVKLEKKAKFIHIETSPEGAEVYIDDSFTGYSPISTPINSGKHEVLLIKKGYYSKKYDINIEKGSDDVYFTFPSLEPKDEKGTNVDSQKNSKDVAGDTQENNDVPKNNDTQKVNNDTKTDSQTDTGENQKPTPIEDVYKK